MESPGVYSSREIIQSSLLLQFEPKLEKMLANRVYSLQANLYSYCVTTVMIEIVKLSVFLYFRIVKKKHMQGSFMHMMRDLCSYTATVR